MGGTGSSSYFPQMSPEERQRRIRDEEERTHDQAFEAAVSVELERVLSEIGPHDAEAVGDHLAEIKAALSEDLEGTIDTLFGGSVAKHTYVEGLSDVDALVILSRTELSEEVPSQALLHFQRELQDRFPNTRVELGGISVKVHFSDAEVQLLPARREDDRLEIPSSLGDRWIRINPEQFASKLTDVNQSLGGKVVPTIKLAKLVNSNLRPEQRLSGYHLEALAVEIFANYEGPRNTKSMLNRFFERAPDYIRTPLRDQTRQTHYVDGYLDESLGRREAAVGAFERAYRRFRNADGARSVEQWLQPLQ